MKRMRIMRADHAGDAVHGAVPQPKRRVTLDVRRAMSFAHRGENCIQAFTRNAEAGAPETPKGKACLTAT